MTQETSRSAKSGYVMLALTVLILIAAIAVFVVGASHQDPVLIVPALLLLAIGLTLMTGFFVVNPNDSRVLILFGTYKGSVKENGFYWANPFLSKKRITLRARNLNGDRLKVNDKAGNPIEIAAVIVWQVADTYRASFDVDNYEEYVIVQSEAAVRNLAGSYPYDNFNDDEHESLTLRAGTEVVNELLEKKLNERVANAGVRVIEARISHLAYAQEIAEAMLRRQQASAVVAARTQIVDGAVSMVDLALKKLSADGIVEFDDEKKATMVSNLLVVLCSESHATPVVNAGSLY
jgi:regulator of protease activity HflC (stomatin/prohibitin superfamily)